MRRCRDAATGQLTWVEGRRKNSSLFITLLRRSLEAYPAAKVIHLVPDNCRIRHSRITRRALADGGGRLVLHFLPPYRPDENKIERLWQDLYAAVSRSHLCKSMNTLMGRVRGILRRRTGSTATRYLQEAA